MQLLAIPGASGDEGAVSRFVVEQLKAAGAPHSAITSDAAHRRTVIAGQTGNLVLKLPGTQRKVRRMLVSHLDTVPVCVGSRPRRKGNFVDSADPATGLGADNRAGVAVILQTALEILRRDLPHPPLTFLWTVQEEVGLQGVRYLKKSMLGGPKLCFNWDGGSPEKLTIGATGGYRMSVVVRGLASHAGGAPEQGVSAITIAALAIADLHQNGWHGDISKGRKHGTSNVGVIHGGRATNVVADEVVLRVEARSHDASFRQRIVREIEKAFQKAVRAVTNDSGRRGSVAFEGSLDYESFRLPQDDPSLAAAEMAISRLAGRPLQAIANGGLDANWLCRHGLPTVSMGCGQLRQHMVSESLDIKQFQFACRVGLMLATATENENDGA